MNEGPLIGYKNGRSGATVRRYRDGTAMVYAPGFVGLVDGAHVAHILDPSKGWKLWTVDGRTVSKKTANAVASGDVLVVNGNAFEITGTSRAIPSNPKRICLIGRGPHMRWTFDLDETVEVAS